MIKTVQGLCDYMLNEYQERVAIKFYQEDKITSISFYQLINDIKRCAAFIYENYVHGAHIGIIGKNSYDYIAWLFGIMYCGCVAVPTNKDLTVDDIAQNVAITDMNGIIYDDEEIGTIKALEHRFSFKMFSMSSMKVDCGDPDKKYDVDEHALACIVLTSGTSDKPKGVMLSINNILANKALNIDIEHYQSLTILPMYHISSIGEIFTVLCTGNTLCLCSGHKYILRDLLIFEPDLFLVVPAMLELLLSKINIISDKEKVLGRNLKGIFCGGAKLNDNVIKKAIEYGIPLFQIYGMTEGGMLISICPAQYIHTGSVGKPHDGINVRIEQNEILVQSDSTMLGYYNNEAETKKILKDGWLHTGDLGYLNEDGFLFITGRKKNVIILSNGENISPEELEKKIYDCKYVREVLVYERDEVICADIFPETVEGVLKEEVQNLITQYIQDLNRSQPTYKHIRKIVFREKEIEKTASNKIKRVGGSYNE